MFANLNTLFGRVLTTQQPVIANDPAHDPRRGGLPPGHPPLHSFLGVPLMRGDEMVGMVGIANREGGFDEHDAQFLAPYFELCAHLIDVIRADRERAAAQTAEREAREAAQRQERLSLIGRLASGVAHDMNNLITVVSMQCELLELDHHLSAEAQRGVARIRDVCDTASTMAARLNGLRTRSPDALVRCQPHEVIEQSQGVLAAIAGGELTLEFHLDAELHTGDRVAMTDSDLLQVLMNLVSNARDAANGVGHVVVSTALEAEPGRRRLRIEVSDNGPGIPSTLRGSAFDPFTSSKGPGHGLGLPTVRTLVEMADGRIELIDDGEPGTTFVIVLPLID